MKLKPLLLLLPHSALLLLMAGCGGTSQPSDTPAPNLTYTPYATYTPTPPIATIPATSTPLLTATPIPTSKPTVTPIPIPPTATRVPPTPAPTPTRTPVPPTPTLTSIPNTASVTVKSYAFDATMITVGIGGTVTWGFVQGTHTTTSTGSEMWDSGLRSGGSFSHTFNAKGTFTYKCSLHSSMTGAVKVE